MDRKSWILVGIGQALGAATLILNYISNKHDQKLMGEFIDNKFKEHEDKEQEES